MSAFLVFVAFVVVAGLGVWAGYTWGAKGLAVLKADVLALEEKAKADVKIAETWVLAEIAKIKAKL